MVARDISNTVSGELEAESVYPFFTIELLFDSAPIRLWTGTGTLVMEGNSYIGSGNLLGISSVEETSEMAVKGATITLSGMNSEVISLALQSPYQGRVCNIAFNMFVPTGSLLNEDGSYILLEDGSRINLEDKRTDTTKIFSGYMDQMNVSEGPEFGTIELKVENKLIDLERQRVRRFTNQFQKSLYPNDRGLEFVENIQDKEIVWGRSVS